MSPRAGFYRASPAEAHARQVDPATWDPDVLVRIPQVQASSSSSGAPAQPTPPPDAFPFPPTTTSTLVPLPALSESLERMTLAARSTPSTTTTTLVRRASSSDPSPGAIVAIVAGVTLFFVVVAVLLHLQEMKAFCQNLLTRIRRWGLATPAKDRQWDVLSWNEASALAGTEASTPEPFPSATHTGPHTARMRDVSIHLVSTAEHASLPPLQPNRRPPSSVIDPAVNVRSPPEPAPPLPRLEPLRRKPSKSKVSRPPALVLPSRESTPPETPPKDPPPLPSPAPSSTSASGSGSGSASASASASEKRKEPSGTSTTTTTATATARLAIQMPKPVRGSDLRPISAYTSASTTLSEMSLLKPSTRPHPHEGKDARLSRVLTVANPGDANSPGSAIGTGSSAGLGTFLPPIPPVPPIPPIYLPKLAAEREKEAPRPLPLPARPLGSLSSPLSRSGNGNGTKPMPRRTDSQSTTLTVSPTSSGSLIGSPQLPLRRQNSTSSIRSPRSPVRKPVPPLVLPLAPARHSRSTSEPDGEREDAGSSIWALESGSGGRKYSLASTALDELAGSRWGSPVPSSSASQMYRTRDSGLSEWTWTRPLEDWEKEQMDLRRKASAGDLSPPHAYRSLGGIGGTMGGGGGAGGAGGVGVEGRWAVGHKPSASMGEMKAMREVVPDVPRVPMQFRS